MYSSYLRLFWFVLIQKNAILIVYLNCKNWIINFSNFNSYTYSSVFWITTAESKQYFLLAKLFTMFHFFKENIPEELKRLFIFNNNGPLYFCQLILEKYKTLAHLTLCSSKIGILFYIWKFTGKLTILAEMTSHQTCHFVWLIFAKAGWIKCRKK